MYAPEEYGSYRKDDRGCTDLCGLIMFIFAALLLAGLAVTAYSEGEVARLYKGINYNGRLCGLDHPVEAKPYLFWPKSPSSGDIDPSTPLCVKKCPTEDDANKAVTVNYPERTTVYNNKTKTTSTTQTLLPTPVYATTLVFRAYCMPEDPDLRAAVEPQFATHFHQFQAAVGGIASSWPLILSALLAAALLSFGWGQLMRLVPKPMMWGSVGLVAALLLVIGGALLYVGFTGDAITEYMGNISGDNQVWAIVIGAVLLLIAVLFIIVIVFAQQTMNVAVAVIDAAADCVMDIPMMVLGPLITSAAMVGWAVLWMVTFLYIVSSGEVYGKKMALGMQENGGAEVEGLHREIHWDSRMILFAILWTFALFWVFEMLVSYTQFAISYATVVWYYTEPNHVTEERDPEGWPPLDGLKNGIVYHLGSIALGALLVGLTRPVRILFSWASQKPHQGNRVQTQLYRSFGQCVECYQANIECLSSNAYIELAVSGSHNFITAARIALNKVLTCQTNIVFLYGISTFISYVGAAAVSLLVTYVCWEVMTRANVFTSPDSAYWVESPVFLTVLIFIISLFGSSVYMQVFDQVADTILYSYLCEAEQQAFGIKDYNPDNKRYAPPALKELLKFGPHSYGERAALAQQQEYI